MGVPAPGTIYVCRSTGSNVFAFTPVLYAGGNMRQAIKTPVVYKCTKEVRTVMHVTDSMLRRRAFLFMRALAPFGIGPAFYAEAAPPAGGNAAPAAPPEPTPDPKPEPAKPGEPPKPPAPKYTDEDLAKARKEAVAEAERKAAERADKERAEREQKEAQAKGEWEKVAKANEERAAAAEAREKGLQVDMMLRDHLAEKHPDYVGAAKWIRPAVAYDAASKDETIRQRIEEAATAYVKDNPRKAAGAAAPVKNADGRITTGSLEGTEADPTKQNGNGKPPRLAGMLRNF